MEIDSSSLSFYLLDIKVRTEMDFYQLSDAIGFQQDGLTTSHENRVPIRIFRKILNLY